MEVVLLLQVICQLTLQSSRHRAINFNESSLLTCFGNDYGYENWVNTLLNFTDEDDVVILISSSGKSKNILNGAKIAKLLNCKVITFSGFKKIIL